MSDFKRKLKKTVTYTGIALGAAFVVMNVIAKKKKPKSEYADRPEEQNPMKGKRSHLLRMKTILLMPTGKEDILKQ